MEIEGFRIRWIALLLRPEKKLPDHSFWLVEKHRTSSICGFVIVLRGCVSVRVDMSQATYTDSGCDDDDNDDDDMICFRDRGSVLEEYAECSLSFYCTRHFFVLVFLDCIRKKGKGDNLTELLERSTACEAIPASYKAVWFLASRDFMCFCISML